MAYAKAEEMRAQGYNYQDETLRQIGMEAMKNGLIPQNGSGDSTLGHFANLGIGMATSSAFGTVANQIMNPLIQQIKQPSVQPAQQVSRFSQQNENSANNGGNDIMAELLKIKQWYEAGLLTEDVYKEKQKELLSKM